MLIHTITTWTRAIPPLVIVILASIIYLYIVGGRWTWPMLLDAGLLALYYWRPATWPVVAFVFAVRHVPFLARELAVLLQLHQYDGATLHTALFILPALRQYAQGYRPRADDRAGMPEPVRAIPPAVQAVPVTERAPAPQQRAPLSPAQWLGEINDNATKPMLGIVGATQLGKSTLVLAALGRRAGRVVITTPKPPEEDPWNGAAAHRLNIDLAVGCVDWTPITRAISGVHYEMLRRKAQGDTRSDQLTLVIDEYNTVLRNAPKQTRDQVIEMWSMGASSRIRLIVIATEVNARGWGIEGQRDLLDNLVFMRVKDGREWAIGRLDPNGGLIDPQACDTTTIPLRQLAREAQLAGREWDVPTPPPADGAAALLGGLLAASVPGRVGVLAGGLGADSDAQTNANGQTQTDADKRIAMYQEWRAAGIKKEQARAIRRSSGAGLDDAEWAEADKRNKHTANGGQTIP